MCVVETALLMAAAASTASAGFTAYSGMQQAEAQGEWANYNAEMQNRQITEQRELAAIAATEQETERLREYRRLKATAEAMSAASGVGQNMSFLEGADAYAKRVLEADLAALRLNTATADSRLATQIGVNRAQAGFTAGMAQAQATETAVRAGAQAVGSIGSYYYQSARLAAGNQPQTPRRG